MYVKRRDKEKKDDFPFIISTNCPDFIYAFKEGGTWSHIQQYISHSHTHTYRLVSSFVGSWLKLSWITTERPTNNIYTTGEGLTQQTWGWNPGSHHTLSFKRDEGNQRKKKENSKYIYKFDGRHNTLSTYPHSRRGWKRVDQQLEEDASLLFHLLCFMSQFLSV